MIDSDKVCKIINCEHYSDCVCTFCDCLEKAYNKGRADAIPEGMMVVKKDDFTEDLLNTGYTKGYREGSSDAMKWIPCSERLPEDDGDYIVTIKSKTVLNMYYDTEYFYSHMSHHAYRPIEDILAWMPKPKPEPYNEQMNGEADV